MYEELENFFSYINFNSFIFSVIVSFSFNFFLLVLIYGYSLIYIVLCYRIYNNLKFNIPLHQLHLIRPDKMIILCTS